MLSAVGSANSILLTNNCDDSVILRTMAMTSSTRSSGIFTMGCMVYIEVGSVVKLAALYFAPQMFMIGDVKRTKEQIWLVALKTPQYN